MSDTTALIVKDGVATLLFYDGDNNRNPQCSIGAAVASEPCSLHCCLLTDLSRLCCTAAGTTS